MKLKHRDNEQRQDILQKIESIIKKVFPDGRAIMWGSSSNGLGFKTSDLDIFFDDQSLSEYNTSHIQEKIINTFEESSDIDVQSVWLNPVSIIRFIYKSTGEIMCDLNASHPSRVMQSRFIRLSQEVDPR